MKMSHLVEKVFSRRLTCSEVMGILMDQPTRTGVSHAHMHMTEGFRPSAQGFGGDAFSFQRRRTNWENPTHLYPATATEYQHTRYVYPTPGHARAYAHYHGTWQDPDRLAPDRSYVSRTGLPPLPALSNTTYTVYRFDALNAAPTPVNVASLAAAQLLPVGRGVGQYQPVSARDPSIRVVVRVTQTAPPVPSSPAHTMFPDGESLVMHLTASLLCDAGRAVLRHLFWNLQPGHVGTVAIFSNTAVEAVNAADASVPSSMIERTLDVDQTAARNPVTGFYPATGTVTTRNFAIDHVVTILGYRATGELNVVSCYPSRVDTHTAIGTNTGRNEDIAEYVLNTHNVIRQVNPLPVLRW